MNNYMIITNTIMIRKRIMITNHALEHEYRDDITAGIKQTRAMQDEYHQEMERQYARQININNDIGITY